MSCTLVACTVHVRALARIYAAAAQALAGPEPDLVKAYTPTLHACMQALVSLRARAIPLPKSSLHMHACVHSSDFQFFFFLASYFSLRFICKALEVYMERSLIQIAL